MVGAVIAAIILIGFVIYVAVNVHGGRAEAGSEIELAPNRSPTSTTRSSRPASSTARCRALIALVIVGVTCPVLAERPSRMSGAVEGFDDKFVSRGEEIYTEGSQCENCHGPDGTGGQAPYTITDAENKFVAQVNWRAPALTVLLRYSRDEAPSSTTAALLAHAGLGREVNKGPLNEQQISNVVDYLGPSSSRPRRPNARPRSPWPRSWA